MSPCQCLQPCHTLHLPSHAMLVLPPQPRAERTSLSPLWLLKPRAPFLSFPVSLSPSLGGPPELPGQAPVTGDSVFDSLLAQTQGSPWGGHSGMLSCMEARGKQSGRRGPFPTRRKQLVWETKNPSPDQVHSLGKVTELLKNTGYWLVPYSKLSAPTVLLALPPLLLESNEASRGYLSPLGWTDLGQRDAVEQGQMPGVKLSSDRTFHPHAR